MLFVMSYLQSAWCEGAHVVSNWKQFKAEVYLLQNNYSIFGEHQSVMWKDPYFVTIINIIHFTTKMKQIICYFKGFVDLYSVSNTIINTQNYHHISRLHPAELGEHGTIFVYSDKYKSYSIHKLLNSYMWSNYTSWLFPYRDDLTHHTASLVTNWHSKLYKKCQTCLFLLLGILIVLI